MSSQPFLWIGHACPPFLIVLFKGETNKGSAAALPVFAFISRSPSAIVHNRLTMKSARSWGGIMSSMFRTCRLSVRSLCLEARGGGCRDRAETNCGIGPQNLLGISGEGVPRDAVFDYASARDAAVDARPAAAVEIAYFSDNANPLKSRLTMRPVCSPARVSTAPFWLASATACAPLMTAAPPPAWP
jgi:hypothetical protein